MARPTFPYIPLHKIDDAISFKDCRAALRMAVTMLAQSYKGMDEEEVLGNILTLCDRMAEGKTDKSWL